MPDFHSVQILDDGPSGNVVLTLDKTGLKDANNRVIHPPEEVNAELLAASVDKHIWICREGVWKVDAVREIHSVAGTDAGAVNVNVMVCASVAPASGVAQLSAAINLKATANVAQQGTLIASPTEIFPGNSVALDFTGTLTSLVGNITVALKRVQ